MSERRSSRDIAMAAGLAPLPAEVRFAEAVRDLLQAELVVVVRIGGEVAAVARQLVGNIRDKGVARRAGRGARRARGAGLEVLARLRDVGRDLDELLELEGRVLGHVRGRFERRRRQLQLGQRVLKPVRERGERGRHGAGRELVEPVQQRGRRVHGLRVHEPGDGRGICQVPVDVFVEEVRRRPAWRRRVGPAAVAARLNGRFFCHRAAVRGTGAGAPGAARRAP